jgi:hypothetical protein
MRPNQDQQIVGEPEEIATRYQQYRTECWASPSDKETEGGHHQQRRRLRIWADW